MEDVHDLSSTISCITRLCSFFQKQHFYMVIEVMIWDRIPCYFKYSLNSWLKYSPSQSNSRLKYSPSRSNWSALIYLFGFILLFFNSLSLDSYLCFYSICIFVSIVIITKYDEVVKISFGYVFNSKHILVSLVQKEEFTLILYTFYTCY